MTVTVYTAPSCVQCAATLRAMSKRGITATVVDISEDNRARESLRQAGHQQLPVVVTDHDQWAGFRPDKITTLTH